MGKERKIKTNGRISKLGSYAIASSMLMRDHRQQPSITCTTFNILAPIYKRLNLGSNQNSRESDRRAYWLARNNRILDSLLQERSSIICLQEFWLGNEELVSMYEKRLGDAGYVNFQLGRTNNRGDGLLTAVYRELLFNDCGDRVAQLLHVELAAPFSQFLNNNYSCQEILIVNTHLLFPHDSSLSLVRLHQMHAFTELHSIVSSLLHMLIFPSDWNGSKRGHVYKFLRSQGFVSSYDTAHQYTDADAHKWVSHRNHRGNICGVDFIWLFNPNKYRKLLKTSWTEAVFGMFKYLLRRASLTEEDAFAFLKADNDGDCITYYGFCEALRQLNLTGRCHGLSVEETKDLWVQADVDGNGLDYKEFQNKMIKLINEDQNGFPEDGQEQTIGLRVESAVLFPPEVEKGRWPENYFLSDHARLTGILTNNHAMLTGNFLTDLKYERYGQAYEKDGRTRKGFICRGHLFSSSCDRKAMISRSLHHLRWAFEYQIFCS